MGYLDAGTRRATKNLDKSIAAYDPVIDLGSKYSRSGDMYMNALGLNGERGNDMATGAFRAGPGYEWNVNQQLDALDRRAASRGMLGSGNTSIDTMSTVHGLADQEYGDWLGRLSGLTSLGAGLTTAGAAGRAGGFQAKAPVYMSDASQRVALDSNVVNAMNNQAAMGANAEMGGSANIWNFGLNLAKLGTGFLGSKTGQT